MYLKRASQRRAPHGHVRHGAYTSYSSRTYKKGRWGKADVVGTPAPNLFWRPAALEAKLEAKAEASAAVDRLYQRHFASASNFFPSFDLIGVQRQRRLN